MKIVLHIGPHKTGTSAIQAFMHMHAAALAQRGIYYPDLGVGERNHHQIVLGLRTPTLHDETIRRVQGIVEEARTLGGKACVFSSEMFVEHEVPVASIHEMFQGYDVRVLAYIRRPDHLWASAYTQLLKETEVRRGQRIDEPPIPYDCSYSTVLLKWMEHFAPRRLLLAPFDPPQWVGGNIYQDFMQMTGLNLDTSGMQTPSLIDTNQGLPATLAEALRVTNETETLPASRHRLLVQCLENLTLEFPEAFGPSVRLPSADLARQSFAMLEPYLDTYRPYFRPGFDESFLHWQGRKDEWTA